MSPYVPPRFVRFLPRCLAVLGLPKTAVSSRRGKLDGRVATSYGPKAVREAASQKPRCLAAFACECSPPLLTQNKFLTVIWGRGPIWTLLSAYAEQNRSIFSNQFFPKVFGGPGTFFPKRFLAGSRGSAPCFSLPHKKNFFSNASRKGRHMPAKSRKAPKSTQPISG